MRLFVGAVLLLILAASGQFVAAAPNQYAEAGTEDSYRLCTGRADGIYYRAGNILRARLRSVQPVVTVGSLENLERVLRGECQGAFVQSDALLVYTARTGQALSTLERTGVLYSEQVHLVCNRDLNLGRIVDLKPGTILAIGPEGAGGRTTWEAFVKADPKRYSAIGTDDRAGEAALAAVADGSSVQCALIVGAAGMPLIRDAGQGYAKRIVLVDSWDRDVRSIAKDGRGRDVYAYGDIPEGTYPKLQPGGRLYGHRAVETMAVDAVFVTNTDWSRANPDKHEAILRAFRQSQDVFAKLGKPE